MLYRLCRVREISPGTRTFFRAYTCPVYCWRSVQLLDFSLLCGLIHASQPIRDFYSSGQCFASGFLQTPPHDDALASDCILPTAGRIRDFHPLEREKKQDGCYAALFTNLFMPYSQISISPVFLPFTQ